MQDHPTVAFTDRKLGTDLSGIQPHYLAHHKDTGNILFHRIKTDIKDLPKLIIRKREALLDQILPDLYSINNVSQTKPKVWFYEGIDGMREAFEDTLNAKEEILALETETL